MATEREIAEHILVKCLLMLVKNVSCLETQQLMLGIGNAIHRVIEPYCHPCILH
jgi:hypothetical protein